MNIRTVAALAVLLACMALQPAHCQEDFVSDEADVVDEPQLRGRQLTYDEKVEANRAAGASRPATADILPDENPDDVIDEDGRAPANDHFGRRITLDCIPKFVVGSTVGSTVERSEPKFNPTASSRFGPYHTIWYKWYAPTTGSFTFHTRNSTFDTVVNVFKVNSGTFSGLQFLKYNDDCTYAAPVGFVLTSCADFDAVQGVQYAFQIGGYTSTQVGTVKSTITIKGKP